jgi:transposase InsO family protein
MGKKAEPLRRGSLQIPTKSSRSKRHPKQLSSEVIEAIITKRLARNRCAEVVHYELTQQGVVVSLSSVKRVLKRYRLLKERSPWKRPHDATIRPEAVAPGSLVEIDTIHIVRPKRFYVYTILDVYSRWAHAEVFQKVGVTSTLAFVTTAQQQSPFSFSLLQSDHGSEFAHGFTLGVGVAHRHTRVRTPNDNAHLERFNRTVQEECLYHVGPTPQRYQAALDAYLPYYNNERSHLSLNFRTPREVFTSY